MAKKRVNESVDERTGRLKKNAQDLRDASSREDEDMDAMVRKSIYLEGP